MKHFCFVPLTLIEIKNTYDIVLILTAAVIEYHRAGLKYPSFHCAIILMKPEYRSQVDTKYFKEIKAVVRKLPRPNNNSDIEEPVSPCPYCEHKLPETVILCSQCKNSLSFCIATGRHIVT